MQRTAAVGVVVICLAGLSTCNNGSKGAEQDGEVGIVECEQYCEHGILDCQNPSYGTMQECVAWCETTVSGASIISEECGQARAAMFGCYANLDCADLDRPWSEVCPNEAYQLDQACD